MRLKNIVTLNRLNFSGIRNWFQSEYQLDFSKQFNFIIGRNGSGKSALLETIYLLSTGQSFKTKFIQELMSFSKETLWVSGELFNQAQLNRLGVQRSLKQKPIFKLNDSLELTLKKFSQILPIQCLFYENYNFFNVGSANRRKFIDWYLFHVEHNQFYQNWLVYKNLLKQRNCLLKNKTFDIQYFNFLNKKLSESGVLINQLRKKYIENLEYELKNNNHLKFLYQDLIPDWSEFKIIFYPGWDENLHELNFILDQNILKDQKLGFTKYGPHRSDIDFKIKNQSIRNILSRGQLKLFVFGLYFAREFMIQKFKNINSIFIVDDLNADLDDQAVLKILKIFNTMKNQKFISFCKESEITEFLHQESPKLKMFHVEQCVNL